MLESIRPITSGTVMRPAWVGDIPRAIWKYCDRKTVLPNIATPTMTEAKVARLVVRSRNRCSGMIGSLTLSSVTIGRGEQQRRRAPTIQAVVEESQSNSVPASETQMSSVETPPVMRPAPR